MSKQKTWADDPQIQALAEQLNIEASTTLTSGAILTAKRDHGHFSWYSNGAAITLEEAQDLMVNDPANAWVFAAANGMKFEMRRPTANEALQEEKRKEIVAWNAAVDQKKKAKLAKKLVAR